MYVALPRSDYYGPSVPPWCHQPTAGLPTTALAVRRGGRSQGGSHVHHQPVGRAGAQLFPCSIATSTPQAFLVASWSTTKSRRWSRPPSKGGRALRPGRIHQVGAGLTIKGVQPLVHFRYAFLPCLPGPGHLAVLGRPGVVRAASHPPLRFQGQAALSFVGLLRQAGGGALSSPPGCMAPRGALHGHEKIPTCGQVDVPARGQVKVPTPL